MTPEIFSKKPDRLSSLAAALSVACLLAGLGLIGGYLVSQVSAPQGPDMRAVQPQLAEASGLSDAPDERETSGSPARALETTKGPLLSRSQPVDLLIPSIDVRSPIRSVGQAADGSLEVPEPGPHYNEAAWYRFSPTPGSLGPSIILGHVDSAAEGPSVFFRLGEMRRGDEVLIARKDGSVAAFVVDEVHRYAKDDFPTGLVYNDLDHAGLRIVTCGGAFDSSVGHYEDNVVVFASLVDASRP